MVTEPRSAPVVGVLALQGGVSEHGDVLEQLGARVVLVRRESDFAGADGPRIDALVLPGGESSAQDRLLRLFDMAEGLRSIITEGLPTLGTCAGLVLLSREVRDAAPSQRSLDVLDVAVRRNALGPQLVSHEVDIAVDAAEVIGRQDGRVRAALIRAPEVLSVGIGARAICRVDGRVLGATTAAPGGDSDAGPERDTDGRIGARDARRRLGTVTGIAFHPELTGDAAFHRALLAQVR
ncbi:pyridoxal 5'-phosphate synthase glutaminase subunit PdxT [Leucobacter alluvii]|uniref:glutaminase n=1 Tax=Leucobacter alluvii TaxID=340321 RepID=A0ABN3B8A8_9MICO